MKTISRMEVVIASGTTRSIARASRSTHVAAADEFTADADYTKANADFTDFADDKPTQIRLHSLLSKEQ